MKKLSLFLLVLVLLTACGPAASAQPDLKGTSWVLSTIKGQPVLPETLPTLSFDEKNAAGNGSCNSFGGDYQAKNGKLSFGPLMSTMMACLSAGVMQQEQDYLATLGATAAYQLENGRLALLDSTGAVLLTFEKQDTSLEGKNWQLTMYNNGKEAVVSLLDGTTINAQFDGKTVSGSAGCNTFSAEYQTNGKSLTLAKLAATKMACGDPAGVLEQESAFLAALEKVASYRMDGNRLTFSAADGATLAEFTK